MYVCCSGVPRDPVIKLCLLTFWLLGTLENLAIFPSHSLLISFWQIGGNVELMKTCTWLTEKNEEQSCKEEKQMEERIRAGMGINENWKINGNKNEEEIEWEERHQGLIALITQYFQPVSTHNNLFQATRQLPEMLLILNGFLGPFSITHLFTAYTLQMWGYEAQFISFWILL